jgi:hypothetical protein
MCVSVRSSPAQQLCFLFLQSWFPVGLPPLASLQLETHFGGSIWCGKPRLLKGLLSLSLSLSHCRFGHMSVAHAMMHCEVRMK